MKRLAFLALVLSACDTEKIALGQGGDIDARLYADVYTWQCEERGGDEITYYDGVFNYQVSLEYAPDALAARELPASGCTRGLDLFPADAGSGGVNIPETGNPTWANASVSGTLTNASEGFYFDDVYGDVQNCTYADELIGEGTALSDAGPFSGAATPKAGKLDQVEISAFDETTGLSFGDVVDLSWTQAGWEDAWVQVRSETGGELVDSVTCNTSGESGFTVDEDVWGLMNSAVEADVNNLYVAVQNSKEVTTEDGQTIEAITRVIHAAVLRR